MSGRSWVAALPQLEDWLAEAERLLRRDDAWTDVPTCRAPLVDEPVPAELVPRARAIAARTQRLEAALLARRDERADALAEIEARRRAARHYAGSNDDGGPARPRA